MKNNITNKYNLMFGLIIVMLLSITFVSAIDTLGTFKQSQPIVLLQLCSTCTYNWVSSVVNPNGTQIMGLEEMTQDGTQYNATLIDTSQLGTYNVNGYGDLDGTNEIWRYTFDVTATGGASSSSQSSSQWIVLVLSVMLFFGLIMGGLAIRGGNNTDEMTGYILSVSTKKYLKYFMFALAWITLLWITYYTWMISYTFMQMQFVSDTLHFIFISMAVITFPAFILYCYFNIANLVRDSKISEQLSRGFTRVQE